MSAEISRRLEATAIQPATPLDVTAVMARGRRRRLLRRGGAGTLAVVALVAVVGVLPGPGRTLLVDAPDTTEPAMPVLPEGCTVLADGPLTVTSIGVVGARLSATIRAGVDGPLLIGPLAAVASDDPGFASPWLVVSAVVTDNTGDELGVATWLSPDAVATFDPEAGIPFEEWRVDPVPEATHVASGNDLAGEVSLFPAGAAPAADAAASQDCARQAASAPLGAVPLPARGGAASAVLSDGTPVWVTHLDDGGTAVLDARSPHAPWGIGKLVHWCASSQWFDEPMHGARYDGQGRWRGGPGPRGLIPYAHEVDDGVVRVLPRRGAPVGTASEPPPAGPPCTAQLEHSGLTLHDVAAAPATDALLPATERLRLTETVLILTPGGGTMCGGFDIDDAEPPTCAQGRGLPIDSTDVERYFAQAHAPPWLLLSGRMLVTVAERPDGPVVTDVVVVDLDVLEDGP